MIANKWTRFHHFFMHSEGVFKWTTWPLLRDTSAYLTITIFLLYLYIERDVPHKMYVEDG